jgi:hypothetical protein
MKYVIKYRNIILVPKTDLMSLKNKLLVFLIYKIIIISNTDKIIDTISLFVKTSIFKNNS